MIEFAIEMSELEVYSFETTLLKFKEGFSLN